MLDYKKRNATVMEKMPESILDQVLARVRALIE
jgi:hypothetical protein